MEIVLLNFYSQKRNGFFYPDFEKGILLKVETRLPEFPLNKLPESKYRFRGSSFIENKITCCFSIINGADQKSVIAFYNNADGQVIIDSFSTELTNKNSIFNAFPVSDSFLIVNSYFGEPFLYNLKTHQIKPAAPHPLWFTSWPDGIGVPDRDRTSRPGRQGPCGRSDA